MEAIIGSMAACFAISFLFEQMVWGMYRFFMRYRLSDN